MAETQEERNERLMGCWEDIQRFGISTYKQNAANCRAMGIESGDITGHLVEVVMKKKSLNKNHKNLYKILKLEGMQYLMNQRNLSSFALYIVDPSGEHWAYSWSEVESILETVHDWDDLPDMIREALYDKDLPIQYRESLMIRYSYGVVTSSRHCNQCNAEQTRNVAARGRLMEILNIKLARLYMEPAKHHQQRNTTNTSASDHSGDAPYDLRDDNTHYNFPVETRRK